MPLLRQRAFLWHRVRAFFAERGVLEVCTPVLSAAGNTDVHIESFSASPLCDGQSHSHLRTSPEFFHKRLLASGSGDIYEIGPVFRRAELGRLHNPEFSLLEWYRVGWDMARLMDEVVALLRELHTAFGRPLPRTRFIAHRDLFLEILQLDSLSAPDQALIDACVAHGYSGSQLERSDALDYLFSLRIQPNLPRDEILLVHRFPACQAALAQLDAQQPAAALRFECLLNGVELANGYQELTDAEEQRARIQAELQTRRERGLSRVLPDERFIAALRLGLPDCAGVALGLERLLMQLLGLENLVDVLPFPAQCS